MICYCHIYSFTYIFTLIAVFMYSLCNKTININTGIIITGIKTMVTLRVQGGGFDFGAIHGAPRYWLMSIV